MVFGPSNDTNLYINFIRNFKQFKIIHYGPVLWPIRFFASAYNAVIYSSLKKSLTNIIKVYIRISFSCINHDKVFSCLYFSYSKNMITPLGIIIILILIHDNYSIYYTLINDILEHNNYWIKNYCSDIKNIKVCDNLKPRIYAYVLKIISFVELLKT